MNKCETCIHWQYTNYSSSICDKLKEKLEIELVTCCDGGYVKSIETESDFGCNQWEEK
jgi:hypothetical protein